MRPRLSADPVPTWPADPFERLDVETWFSCGTVTPGSTSLPDGWSLAGLEALWRARGAECERYEPALDWAAWERWGKPGGDPGSAL